MFADIYRFRVHKGIGVGKAKQSKQSESCIIHYEALNLMISLLPSLKLDNSTWILTEKLKDNPSWDWEEERKA